MKLHKLLVLMQQFCKRTVRKCRMFWCSRNICRHYPVTTDAYVLRCWRPASLTMEEWDSGVTCFPWFPTQTKEIDAFPILSIIKNCLSNSFTLCSSLSHSGGSRLLFVMKFFFNFFLSTSHSKCCCILDFPFGYALSEEIYCQIIVKMKSCKQLEGKRYA